LREIHLRDYINITVAGVWERGQFEAVVAESQINESTVLVLAGSRTQMQEYDGLFCIYHTTEVPVVILGGGRVGAATARALKEQEIDYRVVEKSPDRQKDENYVVGDAADIETLEKAGIMETPVVVITTHEDDLNVYLTLYCRRLRPDVQIITRATLQRNVSTLHRAGADFVISEASMGANAIFNLAQGSDVLLLAEGLHVFDIHVPPSLVDKTLAESEIRQETGCSVIAIQQNGDVDVNPGPDTRLPAGAELLVIGSAEAEGRFLSRYAEG
ncbi:MAG: TrkA family potassium uptake protein, partial [Pirellulales bacterium]|nr:TrkA family potassium uptake protein [Pirellulales bacterium]